jgi:preprotein translocase subunit SecG
MAAVISVLIILCCLVLILAVLIQNPKGGGLATGFQGGAQVMGVRRTADFLEKATWVLAVLLFVFSVFATSYTRKSATGVTEGAASTTKDKAGDFDKKTTPTQTMPFSQPGAPGAMPPGAPPAGAPPAGAKPPGK